MGSAPKERPILFSGPMVKAILAGRKTQTRRVVSGHPVYVTPFIGADNKPTHEYGLHWTHERVINKHTRCSYGAPGDRLWVKETWRAPDNVDHLSPAGMAKAAIEAGYENPWAPIEYVADGERRNWEHVTTPPGKTRVSIHMPRWASRLTLEVTEVRVQRLQEISETDVLAEGIPADAKGWEWLGILPPVPAERGGPIAGWQWLWNSINGERPGCSWDANRWLWCITFKRVGP